MKKLFSSALTFLTVFTFMTSGSTFTTFAENINDVPVEEEVFSDVCIGDFSSLAVSYPQNDEALSNFGGNGYCFYDFLDENNAYVYRQLVPLINEPTDQEYRIELKNTVSVTVSSSPNTPEFEGDDRDTYELALFGSCKPAIDSVMFDFPEFCWIDVSNVLIRPGNDVTVTRNTRRGTYTIKFSTVVITPAFYSAFDTVDDVNKAMDNLWEAVAAFPVEGETRYEQLKSIHDYMCRFTYYDLDSNLRGSALGALVTPGVVCEGYAKAFKLICDRIDIPCVVIYGNESEEEEAAHMWNYVQMEDGNWYGIDVTWDDLDGEYGRELKYDYFLKGSRSFNRVHTEQPDYMITYLNYPVISKTDYDPRSANIITSTATTTTTTKTTTATSTPTTTTTSRTTTSRPTTTTTSRTIISRPTTTTTSRTTTSRPTMTTTSRTSRPTTTTTSRTTTSTTATSTTTAPPVLKGDLNKDGAVNVADLLYCARTVHGTLTPEYSCDANNDKQTDVFDVIYMRKVLLGNMK